MLIINESITEETLGFMFGRIGVLEAVANVIAYRCVGGLYQSGGINGKTESFC